MTATTAPIVASGMCTQARSLKGPIPLMPAGFSTPKPLIGLAANDPSTRRGSTIQPSHSTGRHRRDGGLPSGNHSGRKTKIGTTRTTVALHSHAAHAPAGSDPDRPGVRGPRTGSRCR
jgi:hypothetical protein